MLARIAVTDQLLRRACRGSARQPARSPGTPAASAGSVSRTPPPGPQVTSIRYSPAPVSASPRADAPDLARRKRVAADGFLAVQFGRGDELLDAVRPRGVAELRVAELAREDPLLLLLDPAPGLPAPAGPPTRGPRPDTGISGSGVSSFDQPADRLVHRFVSRPLSAPPRWTRPCIDRNATAGCAVGSSTRSGSR